MTVIFSRVEAHIDDDLIRKFPNDFDFDAMLRKVCEDAGVAIDVFTNHEDEEEVKTHQQQKYTLKGLWLEMERAYQHLVTTQALYGSRPLDGTVVASIDIGSDDFAEILDYSLTGLGDKVVEDDNKEKELADDSQACSGGNPIFRTVLEDSKNRKVRRPRKSAVQSRKLISNVARNEHLDDEDDERDFETLKTKDDNVNSEMLDSNGSTDNSIGKENDGNLFQDESEIGEQIVQESDSIDKPVPRKRGRPKKYKDDDVPQLQCSQCNFVAKNKSRLRSHEAQTHKSSPSTCEVCQKVFHSKRYMMRHKATHDKPQHCCDVCGKMYKIKKAMIDHRKTHDSSYQKPSFKCDECPKSFCSQYILDCHIRDIHKGLRKSYLCSVCGKSFTTKHSLNEHSNAHNGLKPYECDVCGKKFSYETALRDHKYSHLDSKQFLCKHCQKSFSQRSGLKMHMRTHRLLKMFTCSECGRGFTQKQALQRHERVHKGEKPYICKHCGKYFTDASIIRRHLILVHKIEKTRSVWREDIICTIVADSDHHVQKIKEEDPVTTIEIQKEELVQKVGLKFNSESSKKGPTKAFQRYYPRRVPILDDEDNVIEGAELTTVPMTVVASSVDISTTSSSSIVPSSGSTVIQLKSLSAAASQSHPSITLIDTTDCGLDIETTPPQIINQRFIDANQWDVFTSQAVSGDATNAQEDYQVATQNQTFSPVQFNPIVLTNNSKALDNQFDNLTTQLNQNNSAVPWPSMCYYSHLAQLGININNSEFSYINTASSAATHIAQCVMQSSMDAQQVSTTSLIIDNCKTTPETGSDITSIHTSIIPPGLHSDTGSSSVVHSLPDFLDHANQHHHHHPTGHKLDINIKDPSDQSGGSLILKAEELSNMTVVDAATTQQVLNSVVEPGGGKCHDNVVGVEDSIRNFLDNNK